MRAKRTAGHPFYIWDRAARLPLLVDDGTNGYLHADGLIAEIGGGGTPTYHVTDGLASVRGLSDLTGTVVGTSNFDVFGAIRTQTGATSIFAFTGEQRDAVTGMTYLRARYYQPGSGRFVSADTVQPGGPGTQGYNRYVYVGNNPCTNLDRSGHNWTIIESCLGVALMWLGVAKFALELGAKMLLATSSTVGALAASSIFTVGIVAAQMFVARSLYCLVLAFELASAAPSGAGGPSANGPGPQPGGRGPRTPQPPVPTSPLLGHT